MDTFSIESVMHKCDKLLMRKDAEIIKSSDYEKRLPKEFFPFKSQEFAIPVFLYDETFKIL